MHDRTISNVAISTITWTSKFEFPERNLLFEKTEIPSQPLHTHRDITMKVMLARTPTLTPPAKRVLRVCVRAPNHFPARDPVHATHRIHSNQVDASYANYAEVFETT
jgi:hypothetical protein